MSTSRMWSCEISYSEALQLLIGVATKVCVFWKLSLLPCAFFCLTVLRWMLAKNNIQLSRKLPGGLLDQDPEHWYPLPSPHKTRNWDAPTATFSEHLSAITCIVLMYHSQLLPPSFQLSFFCPYCPYLPRLHCQTTPFLFWNVCTL